MGASDRELIRARDLIDLVMHYPDVNVRLSTLVHQPETLAEFAR